MCFSGEYTEKEIYHKLVGNGGFNAYIGTNDMRELVKRRDNGDEKAQAVYDGFIYQVSKNIGSMAAVLQGDVDRIILTGGIAYNEGVINDIKANVGFIAPFTVYPGEDELLALTQGALRVITGEETAKEY